MFVDHTENRYGVVEQLVDIVVLPSLFPVKDPLVDLNPGKACLAFGLFADLLWNSAVCCVEHLDEAKLLLECLAGAVHKCRVEVSPSPT